MTPLAVVVDDDGDALTVTSDMVRMCGWDVVPFAAPFVAISYIADRLSIDDPPDAVVLDVCMPDMDGLAMARIIRRTAGGGAVPLLAVSGIVRDGGMIVEALAALGIRTLSKPLRMDALRQALINILPAAS